MISLNPTVRPPTVLPRCRDYNDHPANRGTLDGDIRRHHPLHNDGTTPTSLRRQETQYSAPIAIEHPHAGKNAIAFDTGWTDSGRSRLRNTMTVSPPPSVPSTGTYNTPQTVALSTTTCRIASIRYTTNGNKATSTTGTPYSAPFSVTAQRSPAICS